MTPIDALTQAVTAAPEDPAPRRAFAEAVRAADPERAQLIELQLALREARRRGEDPDASSSRALIKRHGARWAGPLARLVDYFMFWGGFVEEVELDAQKLLAIATPLALNWPVRHLRLRATSGHVDELASHTFLGRLRSLDLQSCRLRDHELRALLASPHLRRLRLLRLGNNPDLTVEGLRHVARADLPELRFVETQGAGAQLLVRTSDWDGSIPEVHFTRTQAALLDELGPLPWLVAQEEPSLDVI